MSGELVVFDELAGAAGELDRETDYLDSMFESPKVEMERDQYGRPLIKPPPGGWPDGEVWKEEAKYGGRRPYTRASTFAGELDNGVGLAMWKTHMTALYVARSPDLCAILSGLEYGKDNKAIESCVQEALIRGAAHEKSLNANNWGTAVHRFTELNAPPTAPEILRDDIDAFQREHDRKGLRILENEVFVVNDELAVAGTFDEIDQLPVEIPVCPMATWHEAVWTTYEGNGGGWLCVDCRIPSEAWLEGEDPDDAEVRIADKKTGKLHLLGQSIQLAVYAGGMRYNDETGERSIIHPKLSQDWGILAHIPLMTGTCVLHNVDLNMGREAARVAKLSQQLRKDERKMFTRWS